MNSRHFAWMVREKLAHKWMRLKSKVILATVSSTSEWLANEMFVFLNIVPNATVQYSSLWSSLFSKQLFLDACCHFDCKGVPLWPQFLCYSAVQEWLLLEALSVLSYLLQLAVDLLEVLLLLVSSRFLAPPPIPSLYYLLVCFCLNGLQCFDAVGWAAGRASGL